MSECQVTDGDSHCDVDACESVYIEVTVREYVSYFWQ